MFPFNPLKAQTLVIAPLMGPFLTSDRDVRMTTVIGHIRLNHSGIGTPFMNEDILGRDDVLSNVRSDIGEAEKLEIRRYS